jgi:hypothetical protein
LATSLATSLPMWLAGCTYDDTGGNDLRCSGIVPFFYDSGIVTGAATSIGLLGGVVGGAGLVVGPAGGLTVAVQPGSFVVPNTGSPTSGGYAATLTAQGNLTLASADPSNPRIDLIVAGVTDNGDDTSAGFVKVVTGTPSPSPSVPAAPANSIVLAQVSVPAGATSVTFGNMIDKRPFTTATGGILVANRGSVVGYVGQLAYDKPSGSFYHNANGGPGQARMLPFAPVFKSTAAAWAMSTTPTTVPGLSANITCDGQTDLKITYRVAGFTGITSANTYVTVGVFIDGVTVDQTAVRLDNTVNAQGGLTGIGYTNSSLGNTPSAGSHTVVCQAWSSSGAPQIHGFSGLPAAAYMRVEPVNL